MIQMEPAISKARSVRRYMHPNMAPPPKLGTFGLRVELPQLVDFLARHEIALELVRLTGLIFRGSRVSGRAPAIQGCVAILAQRSVRAAVAAASR